MENELSKWSSVFLGFCAGFVLSFLSLAIPLNFGSAKEIERLRFSLTKVERQLAEKNAECCKVQENLDACAGVRRLIREMDEIERLQIQDDLEKWRRELHDEKPQPKPLERRKPGGKPTA